MDLLSTLPEDVRVHVLSFLTTKEAALTSVLSKKWRYLFTLVPSLDIDDTVFLHPQVVTFETMNSFIRFVERVLTLQGDSPIKKVSVKCQTGVFPEIVNRWLCKVLNRGVSELDLCLDFDEDEDHLPRELFVSSTLVNLKIRSEFDSDVSWWVGSEGTFLPMLKCLEIDWICDSKIDTLLPCFPVIEELRMTLRHWIDSDVTLSSSTLTKLSISAGGANTFRNLKSISFDTPNLVSFRYSDYVAEDYSVVEMKNLFEASIAFMVSDEQIKRVRAPDNDLLGNEVVLRFGNVVKLMNGIKNVWKLRLHSDTLEVLYLCAESMPVFNNVKKLDIKSEEDRGWQALPVLLCKCPNLEVLLFQGLVHHVTDKCGDVCDCIYRKDKGRSLKSCPVEMIKIEDFRGTMKEMNMIEHFLDYFPRVKKMNIYTEEDGDSELGYNPKFADLVMERIKEFNEMYRCEVELLVSDNMHKKWCAGGILF